jgi:wyosine [tRNA(Phe)-imidazoG37] synthetase (radical SAM superfamily)
MLYLEPVFGCNYRCFFCLHGSGRAVEPIQFGPAAFERIKPIVDQVARIHITGLGEPFLNRHLGDYLAYFRSKGKPYYINTNGSLIKDAHIDVLLTSANELSISLDAADRQTYDQLRHPGGWDKVVRIIKRISDLRFERASRYPLLYLTFHLNALNLPTLNHLPDLCSDLRIDAVKLSWTTLPSTHRHLSPYNSLGEASAIIRSVASALRRKGVGVRDEVLFQPHTRGCWNLTDFTFVGAGGTVAACCNRWPAIGDLNQNSFEDIWNGRPHRRIFFGVLNHRPVASCQACRQLGTVDYLKDPATFIKDVRADETLREQKLRGAEKLPSVEGLDKEFEVGLQALTSREAERALDIYTTLARRYPDYYEIRNNLAAAYFLIGQPEKSKAMLADIHTIPHNHAIVSYNLEYLRRSVSQQEIAETIAVLCKDKEE